MLDSNRCTAKSKTTGLRCRKSAVKGTTVCRIHGGAGVRHGADHHAFKHGRYAKGAQASIAKHIADAEQYDPLDVLSELSLQRGLLSEYISRYPDGLQMPALEVERLIGWASEIIRSTEKIVRMRNETALTGAEIGYLQARAVDVAIKYFDDPETRRQFLADLFGVPAKDTQRHPELVGDSGE
jgi:hypothetical protein